MITVKKRLASSDNQRCKDTPSNNVLNINWQSESLNKTCTFIKLSSISFAKQWTILQRVEVLPSSTSPFSLSSTIAYSLGMPTSSKHQGAVELPDTKWDVTPNDAGECDTRRSGEKYDAGRYNTRRCGQIRHHMMRVDMTPADLGGYDTSRCGWI